MVAINLRRLFLGGVAAGIVLNLMELAVNPDSLRRALTQITPLVPLRPEMSGIEIASYVFVTFVVGFAVVWLYAVIRPTFGSSLRTTLLAGFAMWLFIWVLGIGSVLAFQGIPAMFVLSTLVWALLEMLLAAVVGVLVYDVVEHRA